MQDQDKEQEKLLKDLSTNKLRQLIADPKTGSWCNSIYDAYFELFRHDNSQIWITGTILIPLSLAGLTVYREADIFQVMLMALGSFTMIWFWYFMHRKFRAFQEGNRRVTDAIEKALGLDAIKELRKPLIWVGLLGLKYPECLRIGRLNLYMAWAITSIWVLAIMLKIVKIVWW